MATLTATGGNRGLMCQCGNPFRKEEVEVACWHECSVLGLHEGRQVSIGEWKGKSQKHKKQKHECKKR